MNVVVTKYKKRKEEIQWEADCIDYSGSPLVGRGKTKDEALKMLFMNLFFNYKEYVHKTDLTCYNEETKYE
jgi:hypothetical protein